MIYRSTSPLGTQIMPHQRVVKVRLGILERLARVPPLKPDINLLYFPFPIFLQVNTVGMPNRNLKLIRIEINYNR